MNPFPDKIFVADLRNFEKRTVRIHGVVVDWTSGASFLLSDATGTVEVRLSNEDRSRSQGKPHQNTYNSRVVDEHRDTISWMRSTIEECNRPPKSGDWAFAEGVPSKGGVALWCNRYRKTCARTDLLWMIELNHFGKYKCKQ